jgi:HAD superfamily hydrolase (TIGR01509 family)
VKALIFDCDGVIVDTERDGHRVAFNAAFASLGLGVRWDVDLYGELLAVTGGKERMRHYFETRGWPEPAGDHAALVQRLHERKTELFMRVIEEGRLPLRTGVARIVDEAIAAGVLLAVCSTSNEKAVTLILDRMLGASRVRAFAAVLAGDVVSRKKPDPEIYLLACRTLGAQAAECVVIEDSRNGLLAAKGAGMRCLVTKSGYTASEKFGEADAVVDELGDPPGRCTTLADLRKL